MLNKVKKVNAELVEMVTCDECGEHFNASEGVEIGGDILCPKCAEQFVECYGCGERIAKDDALEGADGNLYCQDCFDGNFITCEHCGDVEYRNDVIPVHTGGGCVGMWCEHCADTEAFRCDDCDEYFSDDYPHYADDNLIICEDCYSQHWYTCEECGSLVHYYDVEWRNDLSYCQNCVQNVVIHGYHSGVRPMHWHDIDGNGFFKRKDKLFGGVELEFDSHHSTYDFNDFADDAKAIINAGGYDVDEDIVVESDGSLDYGFELISSTATIDYHINNYGWSEIMKEAIRRGYISHNSDTCGLHVHMDRRYFSDAMENVEFNALILVVNNANWMKKFSRRKNFAYCNFPQGVEAFKPEDFKPAYARNSTRNAVQELQDLRNDWVDHYHALNFAGGSTIEMRFNRGTLNFDTFVATMQFVQMFADAMKHSRLDACAKINLKWFKRVAKRRGYAQFLDYLKKRNIEE